MKLPLLGVAALAALSAAAFGIHAASGGDGAPAPHRAVTLHLGMLSDLDSTDPALAYTTASWSVEYATCLKLVTYPDVAGTAGTRLVGEAAPLPQISDAGRTLTFHVRDGFRFSPPSGKPVTAAAFAYAISRTLSPKLQSPAQGYGSSIAGADAYVSGKAKTLTGVHAHGHTLTIHLDRSDPSFLAKLTMPFFCAVPVGTPLDPHGVRLVPSAGPYYLAARVPGRSTTLRRNPYYHGTRPHGLQSIQIQASVPENGLALSVQAGKLDGTLGAPLPNAAQLQQRYGAGSPAAHEGDQRFFVNPTLSASYLVLNTSRPTFGSAAVRKAVNEAIDRPALAAQDGPLSGVPTDHYLAPGLTGAGGAAVYPTTGPDVARARALAGTQKRHAVLYTCNEQACGGRAAIVQQNLAKIGIDVTVRQFAWPTLYAKLGTRGEAFDMADIAFAVDYPDPGDFLASQLDSANIHDRNNSTFAYLHDATANRLLRAADAAPEGPARAAAWHTAEQYLVADAAPWAAYAFSTDRTLFSARVGCALYQPIYGMDLAHLCAR